LDELHDTRADTGNLLHFPLIFSLYICNAFVPL